MTRLGALALTAALDLAVAAAIVWFVGSANFARHASRQTEPGLRARHPTRPAGQSAWEKSMWVVPSRKGWVSSSTARPAASTERRSGATAGATSASGGRAGELAFAGVRVSVGAQVLAGERVESSQPTRRSFDLLPSVPAIDLSLDTRIVELAFSTHKRAVVTVYPPYLEYG